MSTLAFTKGVIINYATSKVARPPGRNDADALARFENNTPWTSENYIIMQ